MKVRIHRVEKTESEEVVIHCVDITAEVRDIYTYVEMRGTELSGQIDGVTHLFQLKDVLYFEVVDENVFAYTKNEVYEIKMRLYEVENAYSSEFFFRCSKSTIINLKHLDGISPALNGRFHALLENGEKIIINRSFVPKMKQAMKQKVGGSHEHR